MHRRKTTSKTITGARRAAMALRPSPLARVPPATLMRILDAHTRLAAGSLLARCGAELYQATCVGTGTGASAGASSSSSATDAAAAAAAAPFYGVRVNTSGMLAHIVCTGGPRLLCRLTAAVRLDSDAAEALRTSSVPRALAVDRAVYMRVPVATIVAPIVRTAPSPATKAAAAAAAPDEALTLEGLFDAVRAAATPVDYGGHALRLLEPEHGRAAALWAALSRAERRHVLETRACLAVDLSLARSPLDIFAMHAAIAAVFGLTDIELLCTWSTELLHVNAAQVAHFVSQFDTLDDVLDYGNMALAPGVAARLAGSEIWRRVVARAAEERCAAVVAGASSVSIGSELESEGEAAVAVAAAPSTAAAAAHASGPGQNGLDEVVRAAADLEALSIGCGAAPPADIETVEDALSTFVDTMAQAYLEAEPCDGAEAAAEAATPPPIAEAYVTLGWIHLRKALLDAVVESFAHLALMLDVLPLPGGQTPAGTLQPQPPSSVPSKPGATPTPPSTAAAKQPPVRLSKAGRKQRAVAAAAAAAKQTAAEAVAPTLAPPTPSQSPLPSLAPTPAASRGAHALYMAQLAAIYDARACRVCQQPTHTCEVLLLPCRDLAVCSECAPSVRACPVCTTPVVERIQVNTA